jgi:hypothetical protein
MNSKNFLALACVAMASAAMHAYAASSAYGLLLSGPAESVDAATSTVVVLGHRILVKDVSKISLGHTLNVFGVVATNGSLRAKTVQDTASYAWSGKQVQLTGAVAGIDRARGLVLIGKASVDYTALLAQPGFVPPSVGDIIQVSGTQPSGHGVVLAGKINRVGVNAGGQAVGVNAGGQAVGVNAGGQAVGVNAGGQAVGVNAGGQAVGVNAGGQAVGVNAGGQAV